MILGIMADKQVEELTLELHNSPNGSNWTAHYFVQSHEAEQNNKIKTQINQSTNYVCAAEPPDTPRACQVVELVDIDRQMVTMGGTAPQTHASHLYTIHI